MSGDFNKRHRDSHDRDDGIHDRDEEWLTLGRGPASAAASDGTADDQFGIASRLTKPSGPCDRGEYLRAPNIARRELTPRKGDEVTGASHAKTFHRWGLKGSGL